MMDKHHYCPACNYRYRTRGSCYKHAVKVHKQWYVPGQTLKDTPADELEALPETYRRADRNSRQRAREEEEGDCGV